MSDFIIYILTAISLVFVIEGLLYLLFPDLVRRLMALAITLPQQNLRMFGLVMAGSGFSIVWILQYF